MTTATFIRDVESGEPVVRASLYRVDPPMTLQVFEKNDHGDYRQVTKSSEYIRVSASNVPFSGPETYIFLADEHGEPIDWCESVGSYRGGLDHEKALKGAGYNFVHPARNMVTDDRDILLRDALKRIRQLEQRMAGFQSGITHATKNADRIVLYTQAGSMRLALDHIYGLIENEIDVRSREG